MSRKLTLMVVLLFTLASVALFIQALRGSSRRSERAQQLAREKRGTSTASAQSASKEPGLNDALGTDDGFACAVFYAGDLTGNLETCG